MPVFLIRQTVEHQNINRKIIKKNRIIGYDLRHAISSLPKSLGGEFLRKLEKSCIAKRTDDLGRILTIEIIEEEKA